jgi:hypothetical protein
MEVAVRHVITVKHPHQAALSFEFESHDIGLTQGSTLRFGGKAIATYRPGTKHWQHALDIAVEILKATVEIALTRRMEIDAAAKVAVEEHRYASPWDGADSWCNNSDFDIDEVLFGRGLEPESNDV